MYLGVIYSGENQEVCGFYFKFLSIPDKLINLPDHGGNRTNIFLNVVGLIPTVVSSSKASPTFGHANAV